MILSQRTVPHIRRTVLFLCNQTYNGPSFKAANEFDALDSILKTLKKKNKRVLVLIDEVTYNKSIGSFSHALSAYARAGYEIYVLMTGLKENIMAIKNDKSLTFLYRAKEHQLEPLNMTAIMNSYSDTFETDQETAEKMAWITKGYSFAFQVLGYLYWNALSSGRDVEIDSLIPAFDTNLSEFSYDKIWSEVPLTEKKIIAAIANSKDGRVSEIRTAMKMDSNKFGVYRGRLIERGLIRGREYGSVEIVLPRFGEYARLHDPQKRNMYS